MARDRQLYTVKMDDETTDEVTDSVVIRTAAASVQDKTTQHLDAGS